MTDISNAVSPLRKKTKVTGLKLAAWIVLGLVMVFVPIYFQTVPQLVFLNHIIVIIGIWVLLALGLNIVVGYAGLLDLGYIAFYAMGGYTGVLLGQLVADKLGGFTYYAMLIPA